MPETCLEVRWRVGSKASRNSVAKLPCEIGMGLMFVHKSLWVTLVPSIDATIPPRGGSRGRIISERNEQRYRSITGGRDYFW